MQFLFILFIVLIFCSYTSNKLNIFFHLFELNNNNMVFILILKSMNVVLTINLYYNK